MASFVEVVVVREVEGNDGESVVERLERREESVAMLAAKTGSVVLVSRSFREKVEVLLGSRSGFPLLRLLGDNGELILLVMGPLLTKRIRPSEVSDWN